MVGSKFNIFYELHGECLLAITKTDMYTVLLTIRHQFL